MKKISLFIAVALSSLYMNSQSFYGETLHNQTETTELTTAIKVNLAANAGFLIGGSVSTGTFSAPNFILNKLSRDGTMTGGNNPFARYYYVYANSACLGGALIAPSCSGITVAEYNSTTSTMAYAVAGAFDDGCFFVGVDNTGAVINKGFYTFPSGSSQASKPLIVVSNGMICIIGSVMTTGLNARQLYVLKISQTGVLLQSKTYNMAAVCSMPGYCPCGAYGYDLIPRDAIISPYTSAYPVSGEIIVVGEAKKYGNWGPNCSPLTESSGFMLRLGLNNLNALSSDLYDYGAGNNGFLSVAPAQSLPGTEGFIIGGYSDLNLSFGQSWMLKLAQNGGILWSSLVSSTYGTPSSMAGGVGYRNSTSYGETYYGVLSKGVGAVAVKLDANGNPFTCTGPAIDNKNEFNYLLNSSATLNSNLLTIDPTASSQNEGIHVYGTGNINEYFLSRATFNGVSDFVGCSSSSNFNGLQTSQGPTNTYFRAVNPAPPGFMTSCSNITVIGNAFSPILTAACQVSSLPTNGTNNRPLATGLLEDTKFAENSVTFLPNPNNGKFSINLSKLNSPVKITLFDETGRLVKEIDSNAKTVNEATNIEVDLSALSPGIYFAKVSTGDNISCHKIVYTRN